MQHDALLNRWAEVSFRRNNQGRVRGQERPTEVEVKRMPVRPRAPMEGSEPVVARGSVLRPDYSWRMKCLLPIYSHPRPLAPSRRQHLRKVTSLHLKRCLRPLRGGRLANPAVTSLMTSMPNV